MQEARALLQTTAPHTAGVIPWIWEHLDKISLGTSHRYDITLTNLALEKKYSNPDFFHPL